MVNESHLAVLPVGNCVQRLVSATQCACIGCLPAQVLYSQIPKSNSRFLTHLALLPMP